MRLFGFFSTATVAVALLVSACGGSDNEPTTSTAGTGAGTGTGTGTVGQGGQGATGTGTGTGTATGVGGSPPVGPLGDNFDGSGPLVDYVTNNPSALPDVGRVDGRYRANLDDNENDKTLHFNDAQGRLDAKAVTWPFEVIARNIGVGTQGDSQTPAPPSGDPYIFAGIQVHVLDLNDPTSSHVVVGHRGPTAFTVEGKNTVSGSSNQNDAGANVVPNGRADLRIVGNADRTLTVYWQTPNPNPGGQADDWTLYNGTGTLPGQAPAFGDTVYVGLITYAFGYGGIPFVGTCDAIEGGPL
ncbi:MAG: hypothetical protein RIF41_01175 [Polyangiaceae bacterium]